MEVVQVAADPTRPDQSEDWAIVDANRGLGVVADGTGTSFDPRAWAQTLCLAVSDCALDDPAAAIADAWCHGVREFRADAIPSQRVGLDEKPSAATIGVLIVRPPVWRFAAVGDVGLVVRRGGTIMVRETLQRTADYGSVPHLLRDTSGRPVARVLSGHVSDGDEIFCFTDGLGPWLVAHLDDETLDSLWRVDTAAFGELVERVRASGDLVSDDATLLRCLVVTSPVEEPDPTTGAG